MKLLPMILKEIEIKYQAINQKTETQLEGLLWSKPITYWDYIHTDALLNLQIQRTTLPDEMVFIMYHQVNELIFKMILWEMNQISYCQDIKADFFTEIFVEINLDCALPTIRGQIYAISPLFHLDIHLASHGCLHRNFIKRSWRTAAPAGSWPTDEA